MIDAKILIVDDNQSVLESARMFLKQEFRTVNTESNPREITNHLNKELYDVVLLDMNFKPGVNDGEEGFYWLDLIIEMSPEIIVILITAYGEVNLAVEAMKRGAADFVLKPWKNQKLLATIMSGLNLRNSRLEVKSLKRNKQQLVSVMHGNRVRIIGSSPSIKEMLSMIKRVATSDANVLILGENGTGKELVARELHHNSLRATAPFISVDMGAISESLFESELFGHVKGAFTDAFESKTGSFELAAGGTIFLDEIGNLSLRLQAKLLSVLQNREITPVGGNNKMPFDARVIAATNMPVKKMVDDKTFRQDLLFRINTVEILVPPLRERRSDIKELFAHYNDFYSEQYRKRPLKLSSKVAKRLETYDWPGNIRELQHAVERAVILSDNGLIEDSTLLVGSLERTNSDIFEADTLEEMEKHFILKKLADNNGNVTKTAKSLGLTRTALYRRINKHRLY